MNLHHDPLTATFARWSRRPEPNGWGVERMAPVVIPLSPIARWALAANRAFWRFFG